MGLNIHGLTLRQGSVSVKASSPATLIVPLNPRRSKVHLQATDIDDFVYIGGSAVKLGEGVELCKGASTNQRLLTLETQSAVYGMAHTHEQDVLWLEESE